MNVLTIFTDTHKAPVEFLNWSIFLKLRTEMDFFFVGIENLEFRNKN